MDVLDATGVLQTKRLTAYPFQGVRIQEQTRNKPDSRRNTQIFAFWDEAPIKWVWYGRRRLAGHAVEIWFWAGLSILIGYLPFARWVVQLLKGQDLKTIGTGNLGVSAAFHHGGVTAGILTVTLEVARSVGVVLVAQMLAGQGVWESVCLLALVFGRNLGGGGGVTNTFWGGLMYSPLTVLGVATSGGILFLLTRNRRWVRTYIYASLPFWIYVLERDLGEALVAVVLALLLGWMDHNLADDLDLKPEENQSSSTVQSFLRGSDNRPKSS